MNLYLCTYAYIKGHSISCVRNNSWNELVTAMNVVTKFSTLHDSVRVRVVAQHDKVH